MSSGVNTVENFTNETRFALMEQSINNLNQTLQRLETRFDKIDDSFDKIDQKFEKVDQRFEKVDKEIKEVQKELKAEIRSNFFWVLGFIGAVFAVVAHGFHWF